MSQITMLANTTGTGVFTIQSPGTNTNRTITLPDATGTVLTTDSLTTAVTTQMNATGSAPMYACRAWVYFNGNTGAIVAQGNVASVVRTAAGSYTINFATAIEDVNYAVIGQSGLQINNYMTSVMTVARATTSVQVNVKSTNHALYDAPDMSVAIFR